MDLCGYFYALSDLTLNIILVMARPIRSLDVEIWAFGKVFSLSDYL